MPINSRPDTSAALHGTAFDGPVKSRGAGFVTKLWALSKLGGEEFIFLLPETGSEQAELICRKLLKELSAADMGTDNAAIRITATIGITELRPTDKELNALTRRADAALYKGKTAGRNRTEILAG